MKVKAKFIGKTGSLNYINGGTYFLFIKTGNNSLWVYPDISHANCIPCEYQSLKSFLNNWYII